MKRIAFLLMMLSAAIAQAAGQDQKTVLAKKIVDELFSIGPEADIPGKCSFLFWPAMKELSKQSNWPRLELIRDISTVGDLFEVWPSRDSLLAAVYENMPKDALQEYIDMTQADEGDTKARTETEFALDTLSMLGSSDRLPGDLRFLVAQTQKKYREHRLVVPSVITKEALLKAFRGENRLAEFLYEYFMKHSGG